jgi:hypothetical protein
MIECPFTQGASGISASAVRRGFSGAMPSALVIIDSCFAPKNSDLRA